MNPDDESGETIAGVVGSSVGVTPSTADFDARLAQARLSRAEVLARSVEHTSTGKRNARGMERRIEAARAERDIRLERDPKPVAAGPGRSSGDTPPLFETLRSSAIVHVAPTRSQTDPSIPQSRTRWSIASLLIAASVVLAAIFTGVMTDPFRSAPEPVVTRARSNGQRLAGAPISTAGVGTSAVTFDLRPPGAATVPDRPVASKGDTAPAFPVVWTDHVVPPGSVLQVSMSRPGDPPVAPDEVDLPEAPGATALRLTQPSSRDVQVAVAATFDPAIPFAPVPPRLDTADASMEEIPVAAFPSVPPSTVGRPDGPAPPAADVDAILPSFDDPRVPAPAARPLGPATAPTAPSPVDGSLRPAVGAETPVPARPYSAAADRVPVVLALATAGPRRTSPLPIRSQAPDTVRRCPLMGSCISGAPLPNLALIVSDGGDLGGLERMLGTLGLDDAKAVHAPLAVRHGQIRYFREVDAALAETLAEKAGYDLLDMTWYRPQPSTATIEMRVPGPDAEG